MRVLGVMAVVLAAVYAWYLHAYPSVTLRYRLVLEVASGDRILTGAGVQQVTYAKGVALMSNYSSISIVDVKGEAVAVDLGARGSLFVTLHAANGRRSDPKWLLTQAFGFPGGGLGYLPEGENYERLRKLTGRRDVAPSDLPLLVQFGDLNDPRTVTQVDPNNLAASFGPGAYLKRATVEITNAPLTVGIEKQLKWLGPLRARGGTLDGDTKVARASNTVANRLGAGSFVIK